MTRTFEYSPDCCLNFHFGKDNVSLEILIRDHGDKHPPGYSDSLGVTFAEFVGCLKKAEQTGAAAAGFMSFDLGQGGLRQMHFRDHMRGEQQRASLTERQWDNLLALADLYSSVAS